MVVYLRAHEARRLERAGHDPAQWVRDLVHRAIEVRLMMGDWDEAPAWEQLEIEGIVLSADGHADVDHDQAVAAVETETRRLGRRMLIMLDWLHKHDEQAGTLLALTAGGALCLERSLCLSHHFLNLPLL